MTFVQIEHPVRDFEIWKRAFDGDPVDRKGCGVQRYRVLRPTDDDKYIIVELEFAADDQAQAFLAKMRDLWSDVEGTFMQNPRARIVREVEAVEVY